MQVRRFFWLLLFAAFGLSAALTFIILDREFVTPPVSKGPMTISPEPTTARRSAEFVTRSGSQLMLNGSPFRFAGANMHWLALDDFTNYPSEFRVNDGLDAAKEMGATVVRSHDLGISVGCSNCIEPSLGVFNETALVHIDFVIKAARH